MRVSSQWVLCGLVLPLAVACGGDDKADDDEPCSLEAQTGCEQGLVCEEVVGGEPGCFAPITVKGKVFDTGSSAGVEGARVVARDANDAPISSVAVTDSSGDYSLNVPTRRNQEGEPQEATYTLRADAAGYLTYPLPPRVAIPILVSNATEGVVQSAATDIGLVPLEDTAGLGAISGEVLLDGARGTLVVANSGGVGVTGIADRDGQYTVFNVPAGAVEVVGYKQGFNLKPASASVTAGETASGVDLESLGETAATVSGKIEIVNPGMGTDTSVILAVKSTFLEDAARGEVPPGLRVSEVSGAFEVPGVPDGTYVVLAAFENDFLVRDPDYTIGGTSIVEVTVSGGSVALSESFKVTGALDVVSPDGEETVTGTPTFVWNDDSSEKSYGVSVFDAFGALIWEKNDLPSVSGSRDVSVEYGGPALTPGQIYQFRATSFAGDGAPISRTEDLRGVFIYE